MRLFSLLCLLCGLASAVHAQSELTNQNLFDTAPFLPEHYAERVARFEQEPVVMDRVLFLGNSITEGGNWADLLGDSTVINRGIGGDVTFGILERLADITKRQPSKLFLMIGINDIGKDIPDAVIADNVRQIVQRVQAESPDTEILVQSLLPVDPAFPGFPQHYDKEAHVLNVNRLLRIVAAATGVAYVDLFSVFIDDRYRLDTAYSRDGLHINQAGYERWVKYLKEQGYL